VQEILTLATASYLSGLSSGQELLNSQISWAAHCPAYREF
jgi:hypothetical protein